MRDNKFLNYYQAELMRLRSSGSSFAKRHPETASKLDLKGGESSDPHTERILESVAFMTANLHQKIDDNAQYLAFHLLSALYPNLINTFPPCGIVQFNVGTGPTMSDNFHIPKNTKVITSARDGCSCVFRTVFGIDLYPLRVTDVCVLPKAKKNRETNVGDSSLSITVATTANPIEMLEINELLFCINSEILEDCLGVYEAIFANPKRQILLKIHDKELEIDRSCVIQCGFADDETVCPVSKYSTNSLQLFQEVLHFPRKFMFFKITNFHQFIVRSNLTNIDSFSILIDISEQNDRFSEIVKNTPIILDAVPIVNLFEVTSDPFRFDGIKNKYLLLADQSRDRFLEIQSIKSVHMLNAKTKEDSTIPPYFSLAADSENDATPDIFWTYSKESAEIRGLDGMDTYISFVDSNMDPKTSYDMVAYAQILCTNRFETRDIPSHTRIQTESLEIGGYSAELLHKISKPVEITEGRNALWTLISQLATTHITIASSENLLTNLSKLIEILSCDSIIQAKETLNQISNIKIDEVVRRIGQEAWRGFVRGLQISVYTKFEVNNGRLFLLCNILNHYLSSHISLNSFIELHLISGINNKELASWLPRSGSRLFL
ncbi:MAG: type VI secretion system baseplate subunit TssF [Holosporales bacterium]|jgi:type VI secretion system protein ImpG|nr:type VI secretion system baseplate subunit TssF [Holosporales bacterium]